MKTRTLKTESINKENNQPLLDLWRDSNLTSINPPKNNEVDLIFMVRDNQLEFLWVLVFHVGE